MQKNEYLKQWTRIVSKQMPHLSIPEVVGLATWSFGMVMTKSSSLSKVSQFIAVVNGEKASTVRQRLREWYEEAEAKKGLHRRSLDVSSCFAPLLKWVLGLLPKNLAQIALALDATTVGNKFVVLSLNILLAGSGIPVAWRIVRANQPGSWKEHWQELINSLQSVIPTEFEVILTADRGLYADWLYQLIVDAGWHPFLRINHQGTYHTPSKPTWQPLADVVSAPGQSWSSSIVCFKTNPLQCTLLARWDIGYKDPWLILTDLEPSKASALWYGLRPSTECVYRDVKSDGWCWHNTRLLNPQRAERLWLAIAVATLWMVIKGGEAENKSHSPCFEQLPSRHRVFSLPLNLNPPRHLSCFVLGLLTLLADLLNHLPILLPRWSSFPSTPVDDFFCCNSS